MPSFDYYSDDESRALIGAMIEILKEPTAWAQGVGARDEFGNMIDCRKAEAISFCLAGALYRAAHRLGLPHPIGEQHIPYYRQTRDLLVRECGNVWFMGWNDVRERTHADVLAMLNRCLIRVQP